MSTTWYRFVLNVRNAHICSAWWDRFPWFSFCLHSRRLQVPDTYTGTCTSCGKWSPADHI